MTCSSSKNAVSRSRLPTFSFSTPSGAPASRKERSPFGVTFRLKWQASGKPLFCLLGENSHKSLIANGVPGGIRTHNLLIRSQMLYPVELQTRNFGI